VLLVSGLGHKNNNHANEKASLLSSLIMDVEWIKMIEDPEKIIRTTFIISLAGMYSVQSRNVKR
jgi:hypothetical protein